MDTPPLYDGVPSNVRPYAIFFTYMGVCLGLTVFLTSRVAKNYALLQRTQSPPKRLVILFTALAAGSLLTTWGFMFRYFQFSYETWLASRSHYQLDPNQKHWGLWLRETSLFKEAWESVIVGKTRFWWSSQIFFFASGLGLYLEQKGARRQLKYTWTFMLLGQIVAISFATNLFLLTLLVTPSSPSATAPANASRRRWLSLWLLELVAMYTTFASVSILGDETRWNRPGLFMFALMAPHVVLLAMPLLHALLPASLFANDDIKFIDKAYDYMRWAVIIMGMSHLKVTSQKFLSLGGIEILYNALFEHPAVSSVGFDTIFCWITWLCWWTVRGDSMVTVEAQPGRIRDVKPAVGNGKKNMDRTGQT